MGIESEVAACGFMAALFTVLVNRRVAKWLMSRQISRDKDVELSDRMVAQRLRLSRSGSYSLLACVPLFSRIDFPLVVGVCAAVVAFVFPITWVIQRLISELTDSE